MNLWTELADDTRSESDNSDLPSFGIRATLYLVLGYIIYRI